MAGMTACVQESTKSAGTRETAKEQPDVLPSWNSQARERILAYLEAVTDTAGENFIPVPDRIAVFDNDGTLWSEQPLYFQLFYAFDRIRYLAPEHPEWNNLQPYQAVIENDMAELKNQGTEGLVQLMMTTHAGMSTDEFDESVRAWIDTARHPEKDRLYTELIYQPMLELIRYLEESEFKVYIVSGGGIDFIRAWAEDVYGIPRERVVGSSIRKQYDYNDGHPVISRLPELDLVDDKEGKPIGIDRYIGRKPVIAGGNSDGDLEMMHWTESGDALNLILFVHHTDSVREWAYDRPSHIGEFNRALDEARSKNWLILSMKDDWKNIYPD